MSEKDYFIRHYQKNLAERLLHLKSASYEDEFLLLETFAKQEGDNFTKDCKNMIEDIL